MKAFAFAIFAILMVPPLDAQQELPKSSPSQVAPQKTTENSTVQNNLPASIRPGHPLDPADVDILTGKKDRDAEAFRSPAVSVVVGAYGYGNYSDPYAMDGWRGGMLERPVLPLTRFTNPFFFFSMPPRGFGRGGFRGGR